MPDCTFSSESVTAFVTALAVALRESGLLQPSLDENPHEDLLRALAQNLAGSGADSRYASLRRCAELEEIRYRLQLALDDPRLMLFGPVAGEA